MPFWPGPTLLHSSLQPWTANSIWRKYCSLYLMQVLYNWCRSWKVHIHWSSTYICLVMTRPGAIQTWKEKRNQYFLLRSLTLSKMMICCGWSEKRKSVREGGFQHSLQTFCRWAENFTIEYPVKHMKCSSELGMYVHGRCRRWEGNYPMKMADGRRLDVWAGSVRVMDNFEWKAENTCFWSTGHAVHHKKSGSTMETYRRKEVISSKMLNATHELVAPVMMETKTLKSSIHQVTSQTTPWVVIPKTPLSIGWVLYATAPLKHILL